MTLYAHVRIDQRDGVPVVAIEGEVDVVNVGQLRARIIYAVPRMAPGLILDLSKTSYLGSRGVHLIIELASRLSTARRGMRVVAPRGALIRRVLLLTRVESIVPLDESVGEAVGRLRPPVRPAPGTPV